ncbi:hypothetical protein IE53DRAFT_251816 [Violaceomyces palustris]|uniref:Uncharacterized protein n=1 Tax=Violaceomyces palustris TaxID=1673888 RepID=A0ACD0P409_9BASI|nr:hypothetical protein IE53DRAFT_251816 [Violaceomyces palustris]
MLVRHRHPKWVDCDPEPLLKSLLRNRMRGALRYLRRLVYWCPVSLRTDDKEAQSPNPMTESGRSPPPPLLGMRPALLPRCDASHPLPPFRNPIPPFDPTITFRERIAKDASHAGVRYFYTTGSQDFHVTRQKVHQGIISKAEGFRSCSKSWGRTPTG